MNHPRRSRIPVAAVFLVALTAILLVVANQTLASSQSADEYSSSINDPASQAQLEARRASKSPTPTSTRRATQTRTATRILQSPTATLRASLTATLLRASLTPTKIVSHTPTLGASLTPTIGASLTSTPQPPVTGAYVLIGWNDLGMHCYNRDFSVLAVLPPFNNLYAQVIKRGDPPQIITSGVNITYSFPENTYSVGKSNFWTYAQKLFGVTLPDNIGLTGKGLSGSMDPQSDHFVAQGVPLTEYNDTDWVNRQPFQLALMIATDSTGKELARQQVVAPVSTEMRCDNCHYDGAFGISTGKVEKNILTLHDGNASEYPAGHTGRLMDRQPVLCAECHSSNALGAPGVPGVPSLSNAMHEKHAGKVPDSTAGCYNCHPGPSTKCLRDVMSTNFGLTCVSCHGGMEQVKSNPNPWLNEPRCDTCHTDPKFKQDQALYRQSKGHGGLYCEACHDSTHAIATSTQPRDAIKFINLQGYAGTLDKCTVCHITQPTGKVHQ